MTGYLIRVKPPGAKRRQYLMIDFRSTTRYRDDAATFSEIKAVQTVRDLAAKNDGYEYEMEEV